MSTVAAFYLLAAQVTAETFADDRAYLVPTLAETRTRYVSVHNHDDRADAGAQGDADEPAGPPVAPEDPDGPWTVWALGASGGYRETRHGSAGWAFYRATQLTRLPGVWSVVVADDSAQVGMWDTSAGWDVADVAHESRIGHAVRLLDTYV